jgi:hypothetical protein
VLSAGGFLGLGTQYVAVPLSPGPDDVLRFPFFGRFACRSRRNLIGSPSLAGYPPIEPGAGGMTEARSIEDRLESARRRVIEAAREWSNDIDRRDHDLLTVLRREVQNLERLEQASRRRGRQDAPGDA